MKFFSEKARTNLFISKVIILEEQGLYICRQCCCLYSKQNLSVGITLEPLYKLYKKVNLIVTSYIFIKIQGGHQVWKHRQMYNKQLLLNCNTWQNNDVSRLYGHLVALAALLIKPNDVCLSPKTRFILKVPEFVTAGEL